MTATLFGLGEELKRLESLVSESEDGEIDEKLSAYLDDVNVAVEAKIEAYCGLIRERSARRIAREMESERVANLAIADENFVARMKTRLREFMEKTGRAKIETATGVVRVQNAGGKLGVEIMGEVPNEFTRQTVTVSADRDRIREMLEAGRELPFAKLAERGKVLVIK